MNVKILNKIELVKFVQYLDMTAVVAILFGGDRLSCCDEGVAIEIDGRIVALATIAPHGEGYGGAETPTIVGVYVLPAFRQRGYSAFLMGSAIRRCLERGFQKVRVHVMSAHLMKTIQKLPPELRSIINVHDCGGIVDLMAG